MKNILKRMIDKQDFKKCIDEIKIYYIENLIEEINYELEKLNENAKNVKKFC